jgi:hypothetical protein
MLTEYQFAPQAAKGSPLSLPGNFLSRYLPAPQPHQIDASQGAVIFGQQGIRLEIPPDAFADVEGNAIHGVIQLELQEIFSIADLTLSGMPTTSEDRLLQSNGYFSLHARKGSRPLRLRQTIHADIPLRKAPSKAPELYPFLAGTPTMQAFQAKRSFDWKLASDKPLIIQEMGGVRYCRLPLETLGWAACASFVASDCRKYMVTAKVSMPPGFFECQRAFLVFQGLHSIARMYPSSRGFTAINIPRKFSATALVLGQQQGRLYYGQSPLSRIADKLAHIQIKPVQELELLGLLKWL